MWKKSDKENSVNWSYRQLKCVFYCAMIQISFITAAKVEYLRRFQCLIYLRCKSCRSNVHFLYKNKFYFSCMPRMAVIIQCRCNIDNLLTESELQNFGKSCIAFNEMVHVPIHKLNRKSHNLCNIHFEKAIQRQAYDCTIAQSQNDGRKPITFKPILWHFVNWLVCIIGL